MTPRLLRVVDVTKLYGWLVANDSVSLDVGAGEIFGLLGPNGAGKTTLVSQILGLAAPSSGSIFIDGTDVTRDPRVARRACSYQPQTTAPLEGLTPMEGVELIGRIRGIDAQLARERGRALMHALRIDRWADEHVPLSGGVARLTGFCMAAVAPGRVVVLDEPTNDVDPLRRKLLWEQVRALADRGSGVLLVTHNVHEAERSVDRLAIMVDGRLIAQGSQDSLRSEFAMGQASLEDLYAQVVGPLSVDRPLEPAL